MKKQGMVWYNILKFLVPCGVLANLFSLWSALYQLVKGSPALSVMPYSVRYCLVCALAAAVNVVIISKMTVDLWRGSANCAKTALLLLIVCTFCRCMISFAECFLVPNPDFAGAGMSFVWCLFWLFLFWLPTYFYLRKRA